MGSFQNQIESLIQDKSLLKHSFYRRWQMGQLTLDELRVYAKEYYAFEKEFPRFLSSIHSRCEDIEMRQMILENLIHEEQGEKNHPELWLRFAEGVGEKRENVKNHVPTDHTHQLLKTYRKHCTSSDIIDGLAALYSYEKQQPEVAKQKAEGLKAFYNIDEESTVEFFRTHETVDVYHSGSEMKLLEKLCDTPEKKERALAVVGETLDVLNGFLDGVEARAKATAS